MKKALILTVRKSLEYNFTTIYRWAFLGEVAEAIIKTGFWDVEIYDGGVLDAYFDDYIEKINKGFDLILFYTDPHTSKEVKIISDYVRVISPETKILVYGRATSFLPQYFERFPFDAIHIDGDREIVIRDYCLYLEKQITEAELSGLSIKKGDHFERMRPGKRIVGDKWYFPLLEKLPIDAYKKIYKNKNRIFEYGISVSKGCKVNCAYCETGKDQGIIDRRRDPYEIINWINSSIKDDDPWHIQLWSSNFFYNKKWVLRFCDLYQKEDSLFTWRCVGNFSQIDEQILLALSKSGCYEVAVGAETLFIDSSNSLKGTKNKLLEVIKMGNELGVNIKCLLMAGIPGQTIEDIKFTINTLINIHADFRYSLYTPLQDLSDKSIAELDNIDISTYDRRTFTSPLGIIPKNELILLLSRNWHKFIK